jgi:RNA polymerase sigma factor (sigma-70 family)
MSMDSPQTARQVVETVLLDPQERRKLVGYARSRYGLATEDAEDLLQDTALELLRQRHYVHSPQGYLFTVFQKRCVRLFQARRREGTVVLEKTVADPASESAGREKSERGFAVRQALCRISSSCRRLLNAYYVEGQSLREAAQRMTLAYSGVGNTINRCLKRLRACLN